MCFSRLGYVKKLACEAADEIGAELYEIRSTERTGGALGFWWCGRYAMHRWDMPIEPITAELEKILQCDRLRPHLGFQSGRSCPVAISGCIRALQICHTAVIPSNGAGERNSGTMGL